MLTLELMMKGKTAKLCGGVHLGLSMVNGGDEGEGIWLMGFIYLYEIEQ
jgi:hypothetical protein